MKKTKSLIFLATLSFFLGTKSALAICPVCTIAVAGGVGLSRWLGIDDIITGLWIGALVVSSIGWTINWMNSRHYRFKGRKAALTLLYYAIIIIPLYWKGIIGHEFNKIWGIDKLVFGIILGSLVFLGNIFWYQEIKKKNCGKAKFPFQKVAMPVGALALLSVIFYFITK